MHSQEPADIVFPGDKLHLENNLAKAILNLLVIPSASPSVIQWVTDSALHM